MNEDRKTKNLALYEQGRAVPNEAKRVIQGGHLNGKTDINPVWRIKKLTEMFGPAGIGWYTEKKAGWLERGEGGEIAAFVEIELFYKTEEGWSKPLFGTGGSKFVAKEKGGLYTDDECWKKAYTDAISVACKALGIGADVYFEKDTSKYDPLPDGSAREEADKTRKNKNEAPMSEGRPSKSDDPELPKTLDGWKKCRITATNLAYFGIPADAVEGELKRLAEGLGKPVAEFDRADTAKAWEFLWMLNRASGDED